MPVYSIPDPETLHREIQASHERCRQHGVNPNDTCNHRQNRLNPEELAFRLEQNREFLEIASAQIGELYQFVAGTGFAVNIADNEGYILHIIGDKPVLEELAAGNCCPGFIAGLRKMWAPVSSVWPWRGKFRFKSTTRSIFAGGV